MLNVWLLLSIVSLLLVGILLPCVLIVKGEDKLMKGMGVILLFILAPYFTLALLEFAK